MNKLPAGKPAGTSSFFGTLQVQTEYNFTPYFRNILRGELQTRVDSTRFESTHADLVEAQTLGYLQKTNNQV